MNTPVNDTRKAVNACRKADTYARNACPKTAAECPRTVLHGAAKGNVMGYFAKVQNDGGCLEKTQRYDQ